MINMKNWLRIVFIGVVLSACSDPADDIVYFELEPRTAYTFRLEGKFADSLYFKNDTLKQWEYRTGSEDLLGVLYVNEVLDDFGRFNGYFAWSDSEKDYDERIVRQLFTQWDTTDASYSNDVTIFLDSLQPFYGRLRQETIGFRNDTLKLMLSSANLQFDIESQSENRINASAGYPVRSTVIEGHPDSSEFYYYRRFWTLEDLTILDL